jgi:thiamine biosynthesis lipoprotein ApbE
VNETRRSFECFGGRVTISVFGPESTQAKRAVLTAEAVLVEAHRELSRFLPHSALARLNRDRRATVPAPPLLVELAAAAGEAGRLTDGLVDATLLGEIEAAGYRHSMGGRPEPAGMARTHPTPTAARPRTRPGPGPRSRSTAVSARSPARPA